jgi:hypothetical protein
MQGPIQVKNLFIFWIVTKKKKRQVPPNLPPTAIPFLFLYRNRRTDIRTHPSQGIIPFCGARIFVLPNQSSILKERNGIFSMRFFTRIGARLPRQLTDIIPDINQLRSAKHSVYFLGIQLV